ncbi:hypothetical protein [Aeromonas veronii]|uniref:hypothetical protein n=1 Tax=Aeromonas veronii TaxID=654 RepID=UPI0030CEE1C8
MTNMISYQGLVRTFLNIIGLIAGLICVVGQQHEVLSVCYQTGVNLVLGDECDTSCCLLKHSDSNSHELLTLTRKAISTMVAWQLRFSPVALLAAGGVVFSCAGRYAKTYLQPVIRANKNNDDRLIRYILQ